MFNTQVNPNNGTFQIQQQKKAEGAAANNGRASGTFAATLDEWFNGPNQNSAAGLQRQENQKTRDFNSLEAEKNRSWQEYMSNTSYQRAMEDMKKAGLNPLLSYDQGGAGTPSGATASSSASNSGTVDRGPFGPIMKIIGLVMSGITSGAKLANASTANMARIASNENINLARIASSQKIAGFKNYEGKHAKEGYKRMMNYLSNEKGL